MVAKRDHQCKREASAGRISGTNRAPGIPEASSFPSLKGITISLRPWMTSVGARTLPSLEEWEDGAVGNAHRGRSPEDIRDHVFNVVAGLALAGEAAHAVEVVSQGHDGRFLYTFSPNLVHLTEPNAGKETVA